MIVKCAEADALRSSFPTLCGGMRMMDDGGPTIDVPTVTTERVMIGNSSPTPAPIGQPDLRGAAAPPEPSDGGAAVSPASPQDELANFVFNECDSTMDDFNRAMIREGLLKEPVDCMDNVQTALARRMNRAKDGMRNMLAKGGAE